MGFAELCLIAIALSMDAFAVSICKGLNMTHIWWKNCLLIGLFFGGFQALMPLIGWLVGTQFEQQITSIDHWVAFVLLALIGGKMIRDALSPAECACENADELRLGELLALAVATSIDALAVGVTFALLPDTNIWLSVLLIGVVTFCFSWCGVVIGNRFGNRYEKRAELCGGMILVGMGLKILLEHLGLLG